MNWMIRILKWQSYNCNLKEADTGTLHCGHASKRHIVHYMFGRVGWLKFNDKFFVSEFPFPNAFKGCVSLESLKCSLLCLLFLFLHVKSLLLPLYRPHKVDMFVFACFSYVDESSGAHNDSGFLCLCFSDRHSGGFGAEEEGFPNVHGLHGAQPAVWHQRVPRELRGRARRGLRDTLSHFL